MSALYVKPSELREQADELEALRQQHLQLMKEMRILVMHLSDIWQGEAQDAFVASFLSQSKTMSDLDNTLSKYIVVTKMAADEAENADRELLRRILARKI